MFKRTQATPTSVKLKAARGRLEHARFEVEGQSKLLRNPLRFLWHASTRQRYQRHLAARRDARCFIATQVYGGDAQETHFLREWRDRVLMPSLWGRWMVRVYYVLSPVVVRVLVKSDWLTKWVRRGLSVLLRYLGQPP